MYDIVNFEIVPKDQVYENIINPVLDLQFGEES